MFGYATNLSNVKSAVQHPPDDHHPSVYYAIWPLWLLFSLGVTLIYGIILVVSSASYAHEDSRMSRTSTAASSMASLHLPLTSGPLEETLRHPPEIPVRRRAVRALQRVLALIWLGIDIALPPRKPRKDSELKSVDALIKAKARLKARRLIWLGNFGAFCISMLYLVSKCALTYIIAIHAANTSHGSI